ncbi:MAG: hypothetical protein C4518_09505 [Desulfobacteraceae bacterium]|nr:MAG: hypothetical protein C4518_09505 [Desulfobacteraceae bacterium]
MRNLMMVGLLIVALIIGILVVQDMRTEDTAGNKKIESIDRAKDAAANAEKEMSRVKDAVRDAGFPQPAE